VSTFSPKDLAYSLEEGFAASGGIELPDF
jgi:hypothetical protein